MSKNDNQGNKDQNQTSDWNQAYADDKNNK